MGIPWYHRLAIAAGLLGSTHRLSPPSSRCPSGRCARGVVAARRGHPP